ncbi:RNA polymerase sigma factor [Rhizosphaericola mali]|uniref:RNA polymerase sigma factor n=1 Tax=Rhizosphaericola mali TaxID=2545455 RepID=UPI00177F82E2|nr:RNA polymerase sigma-70 factor [Rhizosphaericola mali]
MASIDRHILIQISEGNEVAFKILYEEYVDRLIAYLTTIIKSSTIAEEIAMDVFTKIWLGRDLLPKIENTDAFFFRMAKNKAIDYFRSIANKPHLQETVFENLNYHLDNSSSDDLIRQKEFEKELIVALDLLSPQRKKAFILSRIEGLSQEQIAEKLGISKATVNNHITDARKFIKEYLIEHIDILTIIYFIHKI